MAGDRVRVADDTVGKLFPHLDTTGYRGHVVDVHPDYRHPFEVVLDGFRRSAFYSAHELEVIE